MENQSLEKHGISLDVLNDFSHPEHVLQRSSYASLMAAGKIDKSVIALVKVIAPHVVQTVETTTKAALEAQLKVAENQGTSSKDALAVVVECARTAESDAVRMHIVDKVAEMNRDNNATTRQMNSDNNSMYRNIIGAAMTVLSLAYLGWRKLR